MGRGRANNAKDGWTVLIGPAGMRQIEGECYCGVIVVMGRCVEGTSLPSLSEVNQPIVRPGKRARFSPNGALTDPDSAKNDSDYGDVLGTSKKRLIVVRRSKNIQPAGVDGANRVPSGESTLTMTSSQKDVEVTGGLPTPFVTPRMKLGVSNARSRRTGTEGPFLTAPASKPVPHVKKCHEDFSG